MQLPNREDAYIHSQKLRDYLLSNLHPVGKWKSGFFRTLGFDETNREVLEQSLLAIARSEDVKEVVSTAYGTKYIVDGLLQTPGGSLVPIRTVWMIEAGEIRPRFITAYPI